MPAFGVTARRAEFEIGSAFRHNCDQSRIAAGGMTATQGRPFDQALAALYGAAMGAREWPEALDRLARLTRTRCITLDTYDLEQHAGKVIASNLSPHPAIDEYNREYGQRNVLIETAFDRLRPGDAFCASDFVSIRDFERTELYNTVYRALGMRCVAGLPLEVGRDTIAQFSLIKPQDAGDFSASDLAFLSHLGPHLLQAWAGYSHLQRLNASLEAITGLWDRFDHAVMVIDSRRKLQFANRLAEALLAAGDCWFSRHGSLHVKGQGRQARFERAVRSVHRKEREVCSLVAGHQATGQRAMATLFRLDAKRLAMIVTDPARANGEFRPGLRSRFGLTATEAELVNDLIRGESVRDFAEAHAISYETARTHLKNAMSKNGWRRQGEMLVEVLRSLLPPGMFHPDCP